MSEFFKISPNYEHVREELSAIHSSSLVILIITCTIKNNPLSVNEENGHELIFVFA